MQPFEVKDDRPAESLSFAATNLVKPGLQSKRQQSEPPLNRNVFPPTPPPESEKSSEKSSSSNQMSRGASVRNGFRPTPPRLDIDKAQPRERYEIKDRRGSPQSAQARLGTQRTASEPRGPVSRQNLMKSDTRSRPRRRFSEDDDAIDEYPSELYDMYQQRNSRTKRNPPRYIEEEAEGSDYDDGSFDENEFEMIPSRATTRSRATSRSRGGSRRPELRKIRVKVHAADDVRYLMVGPAIEFPDFADRVRDKFGIRKRFKITVRDDDLPDGDMVTVGDQDDLEMAIMTVKATARRERLDMGKMEVS
jgi:hypothetical protein